MGGQYHLRLLCLIQHHAEGSCVSTSDTSCCGEQHGKDETGAQVYLNPLAPLNVSAAKDLGGRQRVQLA
ncbi:unnamed protein product [Boreogadus saida]